MGAFGADADLTDQIEGSGAITSEVYTLLVQLTSGESFDAVMNTTRGSGLEAYRRLARRCDPGIGDRRRNLLRATF